MGFDLPQNWQVKIISLANIQPFIPGHVTLDEMPFAVPALCHRLT